MSLTRLCEQTIDAFTKRVLLSLMLVGGWVEVGGWYFKDYHSVMQHPAAAQDLPEDPHIHSLPEIKL